MVQPKTSPLSIRPSPALLALIEEYAQRLKLTRHAAVLSLIEEGLKHQPRTIVVGVTRDVAASAPVKALVARSVVNAEPIHVHAPQLGTFERKPYQKGKKR